MQSCPQIKICPLFNGKEPVSEIAKEIYKDLYCCAGEKRRIWCKRFLLSQNIKEPIPAEMMPNDERSLGDLIKEYGK